MNRIPRDPAQLSAHAEFARAAAETVAAQSDYTAARLMIILGRYTDWVARAQGLALVPALVFNTQLIDLYIRDALKAQRLSKSSVAAYRSVLLRASEIYLPSDIAPRAVAVGARPSSAPYSATELAHFAPWRRGQGNAARVAKATALSALGLGCGLRAGEILATRRSSVDIDGTDVMVTVLSDDVGREVPMLPRWTRRFIEHVNGLEPDQFVFGKPERTSSNPNAISEFVQSGRYPFKPSTFRMRSTWIVGRLAAGVDLRALLNAAGLERLEKLHEYLEYLPAPTEESFESLRLEVTR